MSTNERGTGRLIGDAALSEVVTFRCTKSDKEAIEAARKEAGYPSIGHYVRAVTLGRLQAVTKLGEERT